MRINPYKTFYPSFDRFFDSVNGNDTAAIGGLAVDVGETDSEYRIYADLPGVSKDKVNINIEDGILTIAADFNETAGSSAESANSEQTVKQLTRERLTGKVERKFRLPRNINSGEINAKMKDGVLSLILPKSEETRTRQVTVN